MINEYMERLCKGDIPSSLVDEIDELYNDLNNKKERFKILSLVGNSNVEFGFKEIEQCYELMKGFVDHRGNCEDFAEQFIEKYELIDDWDIIEILDNSKNICMAYLNKQEISENEFIEKISIEFNKFKQFTFSDETDDKNY